MLKIFRCHSKSSRIEKAEKTLNGTANKGGLQWCWPYSAANRTGFWVYSPIDINIKWNGDNQFEINHEDYSPEEHQLCKKLLTGQDQDNLDKWCPSLTGRTKFTVGAVEPNIVQLWTGCIFKTPPGWLLHIRSPINLPVREFHIQEGMIESDWLNYDIWLNLAFDVPDKWVEIRKNWPPLAQLMPIPRETVEGDWAVESGSVYENRDVFDGWVEYNTKKFCNGGNQPLSTTDPSLKKDSTTYYRTKKLAFPPTS